MISCNKQSKKKIDKIRQTVELIYSRATTNAKGGDFVLMHPTEATAKALDKIIKTLKQNGLKITTISENIVEDVTKLTPNMATQETATNITTITRLDINL